MIRNGRDIPTGTVVSTQVCVVGTGPAGVTVAWELQKAGIKVVLLEGARVYATLKDSWPDKVLLYDGESGGLFVHNEPNFLILPFIEHEHPAWERERIYGGTGAHWGGQSRPFDPIDFEARPGYPGWPINRKDLDPWYDRASKLCYLQGDYNGGENFDARYWAQKALLDAQVPELEGFDVEMYQFLGGRFLNFATRQFEDGRTIGETDVDVIQNATLIDIDQQSGGVAKLRVGSMNTDVEPRKATEFTIKADIYVLACGAVENARLMLLSNAGNEHGKVGRYFICHPLSSSQVITTQRLYLNDAQARLMSGRKADNTPWTNPNGVRCNARFIPNRDATMNLDIGRCWFWYQYGQYYFEMSPNDESYVTLSDKTEPVFGKRRTKIIWEVGPRDQHTYERTTDLFQSSVAKLGGRITYQPYDLVHAQLIVNGHHIGTTRMSKAPEDGVVNPDLQVHTLNNLYVAGSSVFPSTGISNPTFTIIALSIRLAAHLLGRLS